MPYISTADGTTVKPKRRKASSKTVTPRADRMTPARIRSRGMLDARSNLLRRLLRDARLERSVQLIA